ncbi:hypothetical protein AAJP47_07925 [Psychrobacter sp. B38]|uniref:hypothetical protein n=1 Tax=Psychrobacter sp. B38 TaxID=3143538 RepID=UPI00320FF3E6
MNPETNTDLETIEIVETVESPTRRYVVQAAPWEARASQWIYHPSLLDTASKTLIWSPSSTLWSLDKATWESEQTVRLLLRKFPGNQHPASVEVRINCLSKNAVVNGQSCSLNELEHYLDAVIH